MRMDEDARTDRFPPDDTRIPLLILPNGTSGSFYLRQLEATRLLSQQAADKRTNFLFSFLFFFSWRCGRQVTSLLLCLALLASVVLVNAHKKQKGGYQYQPPQKVIILPAGPSATYAWVGHCPPKGKCKNIPYVKRPPFPSFLPPAPPLPYYAPVQYTYPAPPQPYSPPAIYSQPTLPVYAQEPAFVPSAPAYSAPIPVTFPEYAAAPAPSYAEPFPVPAPAQQEYAAPAQQEYAAPAQQEYAAPAQQEYAAPAQQEYAAPAQQEYAAPASQEYAPAIAEQSYGSVSSQSIYAESGEVAQPTSVPQYSGDASIVPAYSAPEAPAVVSGGYSELAVEQQTAPSWGPVAGPYGESTASTVEQNGLVETGSIVESQGSSEYSSPAEYQQEEQNIQQPAYAAQPESTNAPEAYDLGGYVQEEVAQQQDVIQTGSPYETDSYQLDLSIQQAAEEGEYAESNNYGTRIRPRGAQVRRRQQWAFG